MLKPSLISVTIFAAMYGSEHSKHAFALWPERQCWFEERCKHEQKLKARLQNIVVVAHVSKSSFTDIMPVAHLSSPVVMNG